jgi:hypothetical protein
MRIETPTRERVGHVLRHMRPEDQAEVYGLRWSDDPEVYLADWESWRKVIPAEGIICADDGEPVAVIGVALASPGVGVVHMFATDRWREVALATHRWVVRVGLPRVAGPVFRRLECRSLEGHDIAGLWLQRLGFTLEGRHPAAGKNGETYLTFGWVSPASVDDGGL